MKHRGSVYIQTMEERRLFEQYLKDGTAKSLLLPAREARRTPKPDIFSPQNFDEYIGQEDAKSLARIMVTAASNERRALPNIMVVGEYGLGKTSLAKIIMREARLDEILYDASAVNTEFPAHGTFIIDEIHNLTPSVADSLNLYLDRGDYHIIGCTNNAGALPSAFRSRFRTLQLYPYTVENLQVILKSVCSRKGIKYSTNAIELLALRSRFNARQAIMYLSLVFDIMSVNNVTAVNVGVVNEAFNRMGVDNKGLLPRDRKYLEILPEQRAVGLQYLSAVLGIDGSTIEEEIEPYLLRMGFIDRTPRGRVKIEG